MQPLEFYLQNILAIGIEMGISYLAGVFFYIGKRNFKYLKDVLPKQKELHAILLYYYYMNRAIFSLIGYGMMIFVLVFGIYIQDKYIKVEGIGNVMLILNYVLFFAVGHIDARRLLKIFH
jgi:hypothetical protein